MGNFRVDNSPFVGWAADLLRSAFDSCYRTERLLSLYIDGELSAQQKEYVESHLPNCESCKAALVILQATHQVLTQRVTVTPPAYLSERLRQAIAIEATRPAVVQPSRRPIAARLAVAGGLGFAAIVVGTVLFETNHSPVPTGSATTTKPTAVVQPSPNTVASGPKPARTHGSAQPPTHAPSSEIASIDHGALYVPPFEPATAFSKNSVPNRGLESAISQQSRLHPERNNPSTIAPMIVANKPKSSASALTPPNNEQIASRIPDNSTIPTPAITAPATPEMTNEQPSAPVQTADENSDETPHASLINAELSTIARSTHSLLQSTVRPAVGELPVSTSETLQLQIEGAELDKQTTAP
jgi:hypothetical protein